MKESIKMTGRFRITALNDKGEVVDTREVHNQILDNGLSELLGYVGHGNTEVFAALSLGDSGAATSRTQTDIQGTELLLIPLTSYRVYSPRIGVITGVYRYSWVPSSSISMSEAAVVFENLVKASRTKGAFNRLVVDYYNNGAGMSFEFEYFLDMEVEN